MSLNLAEVELIPTSSKVEAPRRELLTPLPTPGHYLLVIDNSSMEKIKRCHMAAAYYLFFSREGHARSAALGFGGAVHVGLECIERFEGREVEFIAIGLNQNGSVKYSDPHIPDLGKTFTGKVIWTEVHTAQAVITYFVNNPQPPDEYRTAQTALEVLAHYRERQRFPDYQWSVLTYPNEGLLIEKPFELPLGVLEVNTDIQLPTWSDRQHVDCIHVAWSGRIDLGANSNGFNRVVDHKTTKIAGDQFVQSFQLSSQTLGYVWAARQLWPEHDIRGFCLNAIHLKKPSPGRGLLDKGPRGGECPLNFFRAYFEYSPERIAQWADDALVLIEDFVHSVTRLHFPLNDRHCFDKFGQCPYFDCCSIDDKEVRIKMLMSDAYKDVTWNPTHER